MLRARAIGCPPAAELSSDPVPDDDGGSGIVHVPDFLGLPLVQIVIDLDRVAYCREEVAVEGVIMAAGELAVYVRLFGEILTADAVTRLQDVSDSLLGTVRDRSVAAGGLKEVAGSAARIVETLERGLIPDDDPEFMAILELPKGYGPTGVAVATAP